MSGESGKHNNRFIVQVINARTKAVVKIIGPLPIGKASIAAQSLTNNLNYKNYRIRIVKDNPCPT